MERITGSERWWSTLAKLSFIALVAVLGEGANAALGARSSVDPDDVPAYSPAYFEQYPIGEGARPFEALSAPEQEGVLIAEERTDYGPDVHAAWSGYVRAAAATAAVQRAAYESGMTGFDEIGVPP